MDIKSILRIHTGFRHERLHFHVSKLLFFVDKLEFLSKSYICNVFKDNSATSVPKLHKVKFRHYDLIIVSLSSAIAFFYTFHRILQRNMSTEYSDVHKGKPDHIDLTAHHTREPDILGKYQILYFRGAIGTPFISPCTYLESKPFFP